MLNQGAGSCGGVFVIIGADPSTQSKANAVIVQLELRVVELV